MKLLLCPHCGDIFNLSSAEKFCSCKKTVGKYIDNVNAEYSGGTPFCFSNPSFVAARFNQHTNDEVDPEGFYGERFEAWICPANSKTFIKK